MILAVAATLVTEADSRLPAAVGTMAGLKHPAADSVVAVVAAVTVATAVIAVAAVAEATAVRGLGAEGPKGKLGANKSCNIDRQRHHTRRPGMKAR